MRIFLKFMNPALWCSFETSLILFFGFLIAYLCAGADATAKTAIATSLAMQGIMFSVAWGLIIWAMHDREKREKEHEKYMQEHKREHERFVSEMKAWRAERPK